MKSGENISMEQLLQYMECLKSIFDAVRIVNPYGLEVLEDGKHPCHDRACYDTWGRKVRCSNCISMKACVEFKRRTKYEFQNDKAYFIISMPFRLTDQDGKPVVLEMINEVSKEMHVRAIGSEIVARTINEFDKKLYTDSMTGVFNRRYFDEKMFIYQTKQALSPEIGFIMWDVYNFKMINDTYGHMTGDRVLQEIAQVMSSNTRRKEEVIRIGGDEFLTVIQGCGEADVLRVIDRVKEKVRNIRIPEMPGFVPEVSAGYSYMEQFEATDEAIRFLVDMADQRMYDDKRRRRAMEQ